MSRIPSIGRQRIAVIGSGISGLSAAYFLSRKHEVHLFERDDRLGGHTHTHLIEDPATGRVIPVDTGFIVHNDRTYPNLVRLVAELGIETQASDMSFGVSCRQTGFEYSSRGLSGFFAAGKPGAGLQERDSPLRKPVVRSARRHCRS